MRIKTLPVILIILFICIFASCSRGNSINPIVPSNDNDQSNTRRVDVKSVETDFWNTSVNVEGTNWTAHLDEFGRITRALGKGIKASEPLDFINSHYDLFGITPTELSEKRDEVHDGIRCAIYRQSYNGIEVENSLVRIIYGRGGKLVSYGADTWSGYQPSGTWTIDSNSAADLTLSQDDSNLISSLKYYYAKDGQLIPSWRVDRDIDSFLVDATNGTILETHQNRYEWIHDGHIGGMVKPWSPLDEDVEVDMYGVQVGFYSYDEYYSGSTYTNGVGWYEFFHERKWRARKLTFSNPWVDVQAAWESGRSSFAMWDWTSAGDGPMETMLDVTNAASAERNVLFYGTIAHDWFWSVEPDFDLMNFQLPCFVDKTDQCTAYAYTGGNPSIHFFQPVDICTNTGDSPTIIYHEYGHIYVSKIYINTSGPLHEANADILANRIFQHYMVGPDLYGPDTYRRVSNNERHWPAPECEGETPHCVGNILAGATWDLSENIGNNLTDHLWHFTNWLSTVNFNQKAADYLLLDDDDDDITNGTPHYDGIYDAFWTKHSLAVPDITNPQTEGVVIDIVPLELPHYIKRTDGGSFKYHLRIQNLDDVENETQIWAAYELPDSSFYGPVIPPGYLIANPIDLTLPANETIEMDITQWVPAWIQPDTYFYHVRVGEFIDHTNDIIEDEGVLEITIW